MELDELLILNGTIEECESPWISTVMLLLSQTCLCINCRKINAITKNNKYSLPGIDDLLHEAKHTHYISTIDLKNRCHQTEINPVDHDKTAFICPFSTYCFQKIHFGLKNAPATFQQMIANIRNSLKDILMLSYLLEFIIFISFSDLDLV